MAKSKKVALKMAEPPITKEELIRSRANYSLSILGMAFVRNGSGQFINIRAPKKRVDSR